MIEDLHIHHYSIINEDDKYDQKSSIINDFLFMRMMIRMKSSIRPIELVGKLINQSIEFIELIGWLIVFLKSIG